MTEQPTKSMDIWQAYAAAQDEIAVLKRELGKSGDVRAAAGWQTLKTAPLDPLRDPPLIMLWVDDGGWGGKGTHAFGRCYKSHDGTIRAVASGFSGNWSIRYWMPLPASPANGRIA